MPLKVVHCKHEHYDIYIGRPSKWGNPFKIGRDGTREEVITKYKRWISASEMEEAAKLRLQLLELKDKTLGCWCAPQPCHGDVLMELVEGLTSSR